MKKTLTILGLFIFSNLFGQIENYLDYQNKINQAELNLIRGNKNESLDAYYSLLTNSNGNFCKDIYNGLLLSNQLSKPDTFFTLLNLLLPKGLENSYIEEQLKFFSHNPKWNKFLKKNRFHSLINKPLKVKIDSLQIKDQFFRVKEGSYKIYRDTISSIDSSNMNFLFELISENEFPGEKEIGAHDFYGTQGYDIVFHHYTQSTSLDKKKVKITPILVNLVLKGKILPNKAALWLELQNGEFTAGVFDILNFEINGKETNYYVPIYKKRQKTIINEYRKWLGLESLDEYHEKFLFTIKNPKSKFIFDIQMSTFEADEKMFKNFTSNMKELK